MDKRWDLSEIDEAKAKALGDQLNIHPTLSSLLINRGITDFEKSRAFFRPSLDMLYDPFLMEDLDLAVNRLSDALARNERILIYGDYDVDGTTSVALMYSFLKNHTENISFYIPDRYTEGYGISEKGIEYAASIHCQLIITLDCGIRALNMANLSKKRVSI
jgi:single-stranded-DNA-specific exonuclease